MEMTLSEKLCPNLKCTKRDWGDLQQAERHELNRQNWFSLCVCVCVKEIYIRDTREHFTIYHQTNTQGSSTDLFSSSCFLVCLVGEDRHQVTQAAGAWRLLPLRWRNATASFVSYSRILSILKSQYFLLPPSYRTRLYLAGHVLCS